MNKVINLSLKKKEKTVEVNRSYIMKGTLHCVIEFEIHLQSHGIKTQKSFKQESHGFRFLSQEEISLVAS